MNVFKLALAKGAQPQGGTTIMGRIKHRAGLQIKIPALMFAIASVSACSSAPAGLIAGAPSSHTPQNYETMASTAAVTSALGGSALALSGVVGSTSGTITAVALTGSLTHNTGRLEINDGTFTFIDANGFAADGTLDNGAGATGTRTDSGIAAPRHPSVSGSYAYVIPYSLHRATGGVLYDTYGVVGVMTATADMPTGGSATYTGEAYFFNPRTASTSTIPDGYSDGVSRVTVDFAAARADVTLNRFTTVAANGVAIAPSAALLDEVRGRGMVVSGTHFTGGEWTAWKNNAQVDAVGANPVTTSNGTFFGYDPSKSAPAEVAGTFSVRGTTGVLAGSYIAK